MGYIKHHAIVVTSYDKGKCEAAHGYAASLFDTQVTPLLLSPVNGFYSFFIGPDGSKEGWIDSDRGDGRRADFINYIYDQRFEDNSNALSYAEFYYGEDNGRAAIEAHN